MRIWNRLFGIRGTAPAAVGLSTGGSGSGGRSAYRDTSLADALRAAGLQVSKLPSSRDDMVESIAESLLARQKCEEAGTFETGESHPARILCSDRDCPCSGKEHLVIGSTAYLFINQSVVDFRRECITLLERNILLQQRAKTLGASVLYDHGTINPFYLCATGAKRRELDLSVALANAKMVAETGFAPLRPTPRAPTDCESTPKLNHEKHGATGNREVPRH